MYEKVLAKSNALLTSLKEEKEFLIGNIFYLPIILRGCNSSPQMIEDACEQIVSYLSGILDSVESEYQIADAINRYLFSLVHNIEAFHDFDNSPEYELFKDIFILLDGTYPQRRSEYMWYIRAYKNYADTNRIASTYKIISKKEHLPKEKYLELLDTIPKI